MKKIIIAILSILQFLAFTASITLQYLSNKKMGVARFLIFYKSEFEKTIFSNSNLKMYIAFSLIILIVVAALTIKKIKPRGTLALILNLLILFSLIYKPILALKAGYFIVISLVLAFLMELIKTTLRLTS